MKYSVQQLRTAYDAAKQAGDEQSASFLLEMADQAVDQSTAELGKPADSLSDSNLENFRSGVGSGMLNFSRNAANLAGLGGEKTQGEKIADQQLNGTKAGTAGRLVGEVAVAAPLGLGASAGAARALPSLGRALTNPVARGAFEGAVTGAAGGEDGERLKRAAVGAGFGAAIPLGAIGAKKAISGVSRTPEAQRLLDAGVDLTPGQMNPGGVLNQLEESWQSVPLVGSVISGARDNARSSFQRVAAETGAAQGTRIAAGEPAQMLDDAYRSFQPLYDQAKGFPVVAAIVNQGANTPLPQALSRAVSNRGVRATDDQRKAVIGFIKSQLTKGVRTSDDLLDIRSAIRAEARAAAQTPGDTAASQLLQDADDVITKAIESQLPRNALSALKTADSKYADYKVLERAVARAKDKPGGFTATDLENAIAQTSRGPAAGGYARGGGGPLRELSSDAKRAFEVRAPATGARLAAIGLPAAAGAANPATLGVGAGILGLIGTQTGRRIAAGSTAPQRAGQRLLGQVGQALPGGSKETIAAIIQRAAAAGLLPQER